jgi:hypothetical protein
MQHSIKPPQVFQTGLTPLDTTTSYYCSAWRRWGSSDEFGAAGLPY